MSRLIPQNDCDNCKVAKYCGDKDRVINCFIKTYLEIMAEQIRADVIDECIHHLENSKTNCHEDYIDGIDFAVGVLQNIREQLKEQKK